MAIWRRSSGDTPAVLALVKADIAESLVKRLTMFVLRAKAKLRVTQSRVWGVSVSVAGGVDASLDGTDFPPSLAADLQIGRASCRERECQYVLISLVALSLKKKKQTYYNNIQN